MGNSNSTVQITNLNDCSTEYMIVCPGEDARGAILPCCTLKLITYTAAKLQIAKHAVVNTCNGQHWYIINNRIVEKGAHGFASMFENQMKALGLWEEIDQGFRVTRVLAKPHIVSMSCSSIQSIKAPARCKPIELENVSSSSASAPVVRENLSLREDIVIGDIRGDETIKGRSITIQGSIENATVWIEADGVVNIQRMRSSTVTAKSRKRVVIEEVSDCKLNVETGNVLSISKATASQVMVKGNLAITQSARDSLLSYTKHADVPEHLMVSSLLKCIRTNDA